MPQFYRLALLLLLFISATATAQNPVDSLRQALDRSTAHDTTKLTILSSTLENYGQSSPHFMELNSMIGKLARQNFKKENPEILRQTYASYLGLYYNNLSVYAQIKRDIPNTLSNMDKAIQYFKLAEMPDQMHFGIISKAVFYGRINEYDKAISNVFQALRYFEKDPEQEDGIIYAQSTLAKLYLDFGKYDESIKYNSKIARLLESRKNPTPDDFLTLGSAYANIGTAYFEQKKYPEAMQNFKKAMDLLEKAEDSNNVSVMLAKMGKVHIAQNQFAEAESLLNQAIGMEIDPVYRANVLTKFGLLFWSKKDYAKADSYLSEGLDIARQIGSVEIQEEASDLLFKTSRANGNYKKALEMFELRQKLDDDAQTEASKNKLAQQQLQYDFEKKELNYRLETEKKNAAKNNLLIGLSGVVLLLVLGGFFYYRNMKQRQEIAALEKNQIKQKLLISQMNPHFIFNSIQNIRSLIRDKKDEQAVDYLGRFSKLTRQILENSNENYISLEEETDMLSNYLAIQRLLYANAFEYEINVEEGIDAASIFIPPMLAQPFVENAVKHGLKGIEKGGKIKAKFYLNDQKLYFEVTDNGRGFGSETSNPDGHKSMATAITKERLKSYSKNQDFEIRTENVKSADGTVIEAKSILEIPYIYES